MDYDDMGNPLGWGRAATMGEADREFAFAIGAQYPARAWILSDRDVWYANPFYKGPAVPHPESEPACCFTPEELDELAQRVGLQILDTDGNWVPFEQFAMRAPYFDVPGIEP